MICILLLQAGLTLRLRNTAFQDEAIYLYAGDRQLDQWILGIPTYDQYASYFSGSPFLYPVLAAIAGEWGGVEAARALSLAFALATTLLLYSTTERLFGPHVAITAAVVFALAEPTLFNGHFATYDAAAQLLLALAAWSGVSTTKKPAVVVVVPAFFLVLAVFTKYAAVLYVPPAIALCAIAVARDRGVGQALGRSALLTVASVVFAATALAMAPQLWEGVFTTTIHRRASEVPRWEVATEAAGYIGLALLLALVGALLYCRNIPPDSVHTLPRFLRALLAAVLLAAALAAPAHQVWIHTTTSLHKHVGFGLWFAAPMAGIALAQLIRGRSFRRLALAVVLCAAVAWTGMAQSTVRYRDWPHSDDLVATMRTMIRPISGRYLVEEHEVPRYYLRDLTEPYQWVGTSFFAYRSIDGTESSGLPAYRAAIAEAHFDAVALRYGPTKELDAHLARALNSHPRYVLAASLPLDTSSGTGVWHVWKRI